jgi:hypothetical protein
MNAVAAVARGDEAREDKRERGRVAGGDWGKEFGGYGRRKRLDILVPTGGLA